MNGTQCSAGTDTLTSMKVLSADEAKAAPDGSLIEKFLASLRIAPSSREFYGRKLRYFFAWLDARGISQPERKDIIAWREELTSENRKSSTVTCYLNIVRQFFRWAHEEGLCDDIGDGVDAPKVERVFRDDMSRFQGQK